MRRLFLLAFVIPALALGACGDNKDGSGNADATTPSTAAAAVTTTGAGGAETTLSADLVGGSAEVPDGGDPDATGHAIVTLKPATREVCFDVTATKLMMPTLGHIHEGAAGVAGPVVVNIVAVERLTVAPPLKSCTANVDPVLIGRIAANPAGFYVNFHTQDFPKGAVRGQLKR
jgi:hypothetical protein